MQGHLEAHFHGVDVVALGSADGAAKDRESQCFSSPMGVCLQLHCSDWRELGADPKVVRVLRKGFT